MSAGYTSASVLATRIRRGVVSPVDAVADCLERIEARNERTNAFVTVRRDAAMEEARAAARAVGRGDGLGPLHGVPVAVKDLFDFHGGTRNTFGSAPFEEFVPEESSTYVARLEDAGAIVVGKTNTPEFGHKGTTDNALFGPTSTPFDTAYNAGGSSGGSAAAVADGLVPLAQGSDGGGSIRIPASFCNVFGFKATYGRVAQAFRPDAFLTHTPFIHAGPITRTVEDAALMLDVMAGPHPGDPFSAPDDGVDFRGTLERGAEAFDVAYSPSLDVFPIDDRVRSVVDDAVESLSDAGADVDRVELGLDYGQQELAAVWNRQIGMLYQSMLEGFEADGIDLLGEHYDDLTPQFAALLEETRDMSVRQYKRDELVRTEVYDAFESVLSEYDVIVSPTLCVPPMKNDESGPTLGPTSVNGVDIDPLIGWCPTYLQNFTGHPAASVPAGLTTGGLPVGLQVMGQRFADRDVLAVSGVFERVNPWHQYYGRLDQ